MRSQAFVDVYEYTRNVDWLLADPLQTVAQTRACTKTRTCATRASNFKSHENSGNSQTLRENYCRFFHQQHRCRHHRQWYQCLIVTDVSGITASRLSPHDNFVWLDHSKYMAAMVVVLNQCCHGEIIRIKFSQVQRSTLLFLKFSLYSLRLLVLELLTCRSKF